MASDTRRRTGPNLGRSLRYHRIRHFLTIDSSVHLTGKAKKKKKRIEPNATTRLHPRSLASRMAAQQTLLGRPVAVLVVGCSCRRAATSRRHHARRLCRCARAPRGSNRRAHHCISAPGRRCSSATTAVHHPSKIDSMITTFYLAIAACSSCR